MHILKIEQMRVDFLTECAGFYLENFLWVGGKLGTSTKELVCN